MGLDWGELLSHAILTDAAVKFDELLKVRRTLTELRTALLKFVKCVKVREPELLAEPRTEQPWYTHIANGTMQMPNYAPLMHRKQLMYAERP